MQAQYGRTDHRSQADANLRGRYLETTELAARYTKYLDALNGLRRIEEIRAFHALSYEEKKRLILALPASKQQL